MMRYKRHTRAAAVMTAFLLLGGVAACANDDGAHTHEYGEWIDEVRATCTEGGTLGHYSCDGCGKNFDADKNELAELDTPRAGTRSAARLHTSTARGTTTPRRAGIPTKKRISRRTRSNCRTTAKRLSANADTRKPTRCNRSPSPRG